jgi:hypothetical protein
LVIAETGDTYPIISRIQRNDPLKILSSRRDRLDMLADDFLWAEPDEGLEAEKENYQIIDLTETDKEIWQEIRGRDDVGQEQNKKQLRPRRHAAVFEQPPEKLQKIRQMIKELPEPARPYTPQSC